MNNLHKPTHMNRVFAIALAIVLMQTTIVAGASANPDQTFSTEALIKDAIVKIYTVSTSPDYFNPWRMSGPQNSGGSGCIVAGNNILTNAHVIANHTFIQVQRYGQVRRYKAEVSYISHDVDLALLTVKDEAFFEGVVPLELGELAEPQQEVLVYGFPLGGDSLSITKGVLSRVEHTFYAHSGGHFLAGQIDAAINPGNSGGPVLVNGKIAGIVMQVRNPESSENVGYMVPVPIVAHFFRDLDDGRYDGFPALGMMIQEMENPDMRRKYGMTDDQSGILVVYISPQSPAYGHIQQGDVLLAVDGHPIAEDGSVEFRLKERTWFSYYIEQHQVGEPMTMTILRDETPTEVTFSLDRTRQDYWLVPMEYDDQLSRYLIYGGIVFTPLTQNLLKEWGANWLKNAPSDLVAELSNWPSEERREVVVALKVLAADVNLGYHQISAWIVSEVTGQKVRDFTHFVQLVGQVADLYVIFRDEMGFQIILDRQKAEDSREQILRTYRIEYDRSPDFR